MYWLPSGKPVNVSRSLIPWSASVSVNFGKFIHYFFNLQIFVNFFVFYAKFSVYMCPDSYTASWRMPTFGVLPARHALPTVVHAGLRCGRLPCGSHIDGNRCIIKYW